MKHLKINIIRRDDLPAFGGYLRADAPIDDEPLIAVNVQGLFGPMEYEDGEKVDITNEERKRLFVEVLMHEFGHVMEHWLDLEVSEDDIEKAVDSYESGNVEDK